jgi:prepilin-type N-terminal cleavage/methylation domain-containing protein
VTVISPTTRQHRCRSRQGLTIVELLIAISIISVVAGLALPAVFNAREAARRVECQNRMRNVGFAILSSEESARRFPASGYFASDGTDHHGWVLTVLPYLEQQNLYQEYDLKLPYLDSDNFALTQTHLPVLTCPVDDTVIDGQGNLSFAVNLGFGWTIPDDLPATWHQDTGELPIDLNGDGHTGPQDSFVDKVGTDKEIFYRSGLFFVENWPQRTGTVRHHRVSTILDGASNTIMLAENVRSGYDPYTGDTWGSPHPLRNGFILSGDVCVAARCTTANVDYARANRQMDRQADPPPTRREYLNAGLDQPEGESPWATSWHDGGLFVCFADGRVTFLSEQVSGDVFAASLSPQGQFFDNSPLKQPVSVIE